jgi:CDP-diacylglycerol--serine O-phosphatidyltransferase
LKGLSLRERLIDPRSPDKRPRRAAYALPTLFTSGNIFLGFVAILQCFEGAAQAEAGSLGPNDHFSVAAKAIGFAVFFDGLDGRIARLTNTVSDFGRELDSLADVITFGIAPAILAFVWGVLFVPRVPDTAVWEQLARWGYLAAFLYLICGAARLARFNVQTNPKPKNPGRPDRKYFVGMPIPAAAALLAAVIFFFDAEPVQSLTYSIAWLVTVGITGLLMVSTWRYPSFKQLSITKPRSPVVVVLLCCVIFVIFLWPQKALLAMSLAYALSGVAIRLGGILRRLVRRQPAPPAGEAAAGGHEIA